MTGFGMYKGKKFQDEQREKLLMYIDLMIHCNDHMVGMIVSAHCDGMYPFRDQLDIHNQCLLSNAMYISNKMAKVLENEIMEKFGDYKEMII